MEITTFDEIFATDEDKSAKGIPIEIGFNQNDEPVTLIVADINHPSAQKVHRKYEKAFENSRHIPKKRMLVWARYLSEAVLKDWSGVLDKDGKPVPATFDNKVAVLAKHERLFNEVLRTADSPENFKPELVESDEELTPEEDSEKN